MISKPKSFHLLILFLLFATGIVSCVSDDSNCPDKCNNAVICVVLAHPDDETIIGGTLSKLSEKGFDITVVYITSGDDGPDMTGRGLNGNALAEVRENEAKRALKILGINNPPIFLGYPDGHIYENLDSIQISLGKLFKKKSPQLVISFGPDGITGSIDHRYTGAAADSVFTHSDSCRLLLHMAVTKPLPPFYARGVAVPKDSVDIRVNVSKYRKQRIQALGTHQTQFNKRVRSAYKVYVHTMREEKFIVASKRGNFEWLLRCF